MVTYIVNETWTHWAGNLNFLLGLCYELTKIGCVRTIHPTTGHIGAILLKIASHQSIKSFVACSMLHKSGLIAKTVSTILSLTVEMRLMFSVSAVLVLTIFVKSVKWIMLK